MKTKRRIFSILSIIMIASMLFSSALAEDGLLFRRNISKTPDAETEKAAIYMMDFYVPAQASDGTVGPVDNYLLADGVTPAYEPRDFAKPLVSVWIDDIGEHEGESAPVIIEGGITFGAFDAFAGVSLDDGTSWKTTNLSRSSDDSSFTLANGTEYPGDVHNVVHQVFGDKIFVAWVSKYCEGGSPLYSLDPVGDAEYLGDLEVTYGYTATYLYDFYGVAGTQGSVDYTLQGYPEIGEIPYSCVWTARGQLLAGDDPSTTDVVEATHVVWTVPERLTSGARDANLPAVDCAMGAGCILTWQEDPEGLRPGQGLGPGEGWSGAIANGQTDIWYSFISDRDFDLVFADDGVVGAVDMYAYEALGDATMPKPYVPMAIPTRLTDNAMCKATGPTEDPYCWIDFDALDGIDHTNVQDLLDLTGPQEGADFCASAVMWTTPGGSILSICVTEDGRVLNGRVASTRVRLKLKPSTPVGATDEDGDGVIDRSAWVIMAYEETKALGDFLCNPMDPVCDEDPIDVGKEVWYHSFDMFNHDFVDQGGMLNQPAVCKDDTDPYCTGGVGAFYEIQTDPLNGGEFYLTEISRRFALTTNSVPAIDSSVYGLSAMLIFKQGIINQGGPADIMLRRVVVDPATFDPAVDNPYAYSNMECDEWAYTDGSNPNYLQGLCLSPAINISGSTAIRCDGGSDNDACAALFPIEDDGSNPSGTPVPKVYEWRQCDGGTSIEGCESDNDLDDQSWENPYDVSKGHRGFLDGDFVMIMYAWSPNWNANSVGNDHYNLYVRRSFDGGQTWTTTPASLGGEGTEYIEYYYGISTGDPITTTWSYGPGEFEQGRNVSLLTGNQVTILDPRYTPTGGLKLYPTIRTDWLTYHGIAFEGLPYEDDTARDPSKFFMIYETGDNTTVEFGEAVPLDLYYSRATVYGDVWELDPDWLDIEYRWPWVENQHEILSGEASMLANPGGTFMYAVWNQWQEYEDEFGEEIIFNSDIFFRRFLYLPDDANIDLMPLSWLSFRSHSGLLRSRGDIGTFIAGGRDLDHMGEGDDILAWEWTSNLDGVIATQQQFSIPASALSLGRHTITIRALDNEGNWSRPASFYLWVDEDYFSTMLPLAIK
jgi:hypothetical protein